MFSPGIMARLLLDSVRPLVPIPGIPMLGSLCSSFHLTPERSAWSVVESRRALARSWREDDLLTLLENRPRPELLAFLLRVEEAGSIDGSWTDLSEKASRLEHWTTFADCCFYGNTLNDTFGYFSMRVWRGTEKYSTLGKQWT